MPEKEITAAGRKSDVSRDYRGVSRPGSVDSRD